MNYKILSLVFTVAVFTFPLFSPCRSAAQSLPAGQMSHRLASQSSNSDLASNLILKIAHPEVNADTNASLLSVEKVLELNASTDQKARDAALGFARQTAWNVVIAMDSAETGTYSDIEMSAARFIADKITDELNRNDAISVAKAAMVAAHSHFSTTKEEKVKVQAAAGRIIDALNGIRCSYYTLPSGETSAVDISIPADGPKNPSAKKAKPQYQFQYRTWFPLLGPGCSNDAILNFFSVSNAAETASNVKYLYSAQQSTSQVNADLVTATFAPGFQVVFAGTTTAGSSQPAQSTATDAGTASIAKLSSAATDSGSTTDSVATAVAKIQAGGDFNLRFPAPVYYHVGSHYAIQALSSPNIGFNINGFGAQNTITENTEYNVNVPLELYAQTKSIDPTSNGLPSATLFVDLKPAAELVSSAFGKKIGLTSDRGFFLGQAAVGVEFSKSFRISFQYVYGPEQIYQTTTSSGTPEVTKSHIGGFHLAVSFSPQKSDVK